MENAQSVPIGVTEGENIEDNAIFSWDYDDVFTLGGEEVLPGNAEVSSVKETNHSEVPNTLPSQHLQNFDEIFSLGGKEFILNNSGTKRLVMGITSTNMPNLKITFKLHDTKNNFCVQFNKSTWDAIVHHEAEILTNLENNLENIVFENNRIRVETQMWFHGCCVKFIDASESFVSMMQSTFNNMMEQKDQIKNAYQALTMKIHDVTKRIKLFMDITFFQLFKSNNIDNRHNYNWLLLFMEKSSNFMELNNSVADTWKQLGKWISNEQTHSSTEEL